MASTKAYLDFVLEQLSGLDEVSSRAMMGARRRSGFILNACAARFIIMSSVNGALISSGIRPMSS